MYIFASSILKHRIMPKVSFKALQNFLKSRYGLNSVYYAGMKCLVVRPTPFPTGIGIELSIRGFRSVKNLAGNLVIYRK